MNDVPHTIPEHIAERVAKLVNAAEDMRQQAADDLKQIYADLREELRGMGWNGAAVSAEIAGFKGAIAELRLDEQAKAKREAKGDRIDVYADMLRLAGARARVREASGSSSGRTADFGSANGGSNPSPETINPETGEIIETQESSDGMASGSEHLSAGHVSPPASQAAMGGGSANTGGDHVADVELLKTNTVPDEGQTSLAAREGEQVAAPFPHSTVAAPVAAVEQPEAPNTSPATSGTNLTRPAFPAVPGDEPGIPSSAADGAKTDGAEPAHPGRADLASDHRYVKAEQVATKHQPKPHCLEPASCKLGFTTALCWKCNDARMKARAEV